MKFYKGDTSLFMDLEELVHVLESDLLLDTMASVAQMADNEMEDAPYQIYSTDGTDPNSFLYPQDQDQPLAPEETLSVYMDADQPIMNDHVRAVQEDVMAINDEDCRLLHLMDSFDPKGVY